MQTSFPWIINHDSLPLELLAFSPWGLFKEESTRDKTEVNTCLSHLWGAFL